GAGVAIRAARIAPSLQARIAKIRERPDNHRQEEVPVPLLHVEGDCLGPDRLGASLGVPGQVVEVVDAARQQSRPPPVGRQQNFNAQRGGLHRGYRAGTGWLALGCTTTSRVRRSSSRSSRKLWRRRYSRASASLRGNSTST